MLLLNRSQVVLFTIALAFSLTGIGCDSTTTLSDSSTDSTMERQLNEPPAGKADGASYDFAPPVFDITATPNGSILLAETVPPETDIPPEGNKSISTVKEINLTGKIDEVQDVVEIETVEGSPINGLETVGQRSFFATSGGLDQAVGAGLWHVTKGNALLVADIKEFEHSNDPDASEWKDPRCEENPDQGFTAGPQSNPYHLTARSGNEVLIGDAAGNTLLSAKTTGDIDWVAVFTPPVDENGDYRVLSPLDENTDCYVQPVPTSVDIGPDGAYYVGELTGVTPDNIIGNPSTGLSRVWRIEPDANNMVCPSDDCEVFIDGLTSIIDIEFGPDGLLYIVEYDANGWFAAEVLGNTAGGTIKSCDTETGDCDIVEDDLEFPSAITFDKWHNLWLLESNVFDPTVRTISLP